MTLTVDNIDIVLEKWKSYLNDGNLSIDTISLIDQLRSSANYILNSNWWLDNLDELNKAKVLEALSTAREIEKQNKKNNWENKVWEIKITELEKPIDLWNIKLLKYWLWSSKLLLDWRSMSEFNQVIPRGSAS
jgi:hypothetical protein